GLALRSAQIGRVPSGMASIWDRHRLSAETIRILRARGDDIRKHLITDVMDIVEAPSLLLEVAARRRHILSAVFTVGEGPPPSSSGARRCALTDEAGIGPKT